MFRSIFILKIIPFPSIGKALLSFSDRRKTLHATYDALNRTATILEDENGNGLADVGERLTAYLLPTALTPYAVPKLTS